MRYAIVGGDMRMKHLTALLKESGREAKGFFQGHGSAQDWKELKRCDCIVANWPPKAPLCEAEIDGETLLNASAAGSVLLLCGPKYPKQRRWNLQYVNLWEDERLLRENAYLTAEAAVATASRHFGGNMANVSCAVVGYGRIGRAIAGILKDLDARPRVFSGSAVKREDIRALGMEARAMEELREGMRGCKMVFSTPPAAVLNAAALDAMDANAMVMDLASPPYGVDLEHAQKRGMRAWREPGLPGRYCPFSAAMVLLNAILRWEETENHAGE